MKEAGDFQLQLDGVDVSEKRKRLSCEAEEKTRNLKPEQLDDLDTSLEDIVFLKEMTDDLFLPAPRPCCSCRYAFRCSLAFTNQRCSKFTVRN